MAIGGGEGGEEDEDGSQAGEGWAIVVHRSYTNFFKISRGSFASSRFSGDWKTSLLLYVCNERQTLPPVSAYPHLYAGPFS